MCWRYVWCETNNKNWREKQLNSSISQWLYIDKCREKLFYVETGTQLQAESERVQESSTHTQRDVDWNWRCDVYDVCLDVVRSFILNPYHNKGFTCIYKEHGANFHSLKNLFTVGEHSVRCFSCYILNEINRFWKLLVNANKVFYGVTTVTITSR